jgi:3-oxoacyl-[acyl-carrier-protein] synthase III
MACSAYPYALMAATRLAADTGKKVLVIDADIQSRYAKSAATRAVMGDAATATIVSAQKDGKSYYDFFSRADDALRCSDEIAMDGFKVFSFVAREVSAWLKEFIARLGEGERDFQFVPHQANMYMVRQLANALNLSDKLLVSGDEFGNVGSSSIPLTLATRACAGRALVAGFGAGLSAAAALVRLADGFKGRQ